MFLDWGGIAPEMCWEGSGWTLPELESPAAATAAADCICLNTRTRATRRCLRSLPR